MRRPTVLFLLATFLATGGLATRAEAAQFYCYAEAATGSNKVSRSLGADTVLYVSPIFASDDPEILLQARYGKVAPAAGLATCISDQDESDLKADRQNMIDGANGDGEEVKIEPMPKR